MLIDFFTMSDNQSILLAPSLQIRLDFILNIHMKREISICIGDMTGDCQANTLINLCWNCKVSY